MGKCLIETVISPDGFVTEQTVGVVTGISIGLMNEEAHAAPSVTTFSKSIEHFKGLSGGAPRFFTYGPNRLCHPAGTLVYEM